ncbi:MAG: GAF domain-containing protein [Candidatus Korobacteraceae bacterium]
MATTNNSQAPLLAALSIMAATAGTATELMTQIAEKLNFSLLRYNWVGFYKIEHRPVGEAVLKLGPFAGTIAAYSEIPLSQGVCGAAASSGETILLSKVADDSRYISRDLSTRSEIVVPFSVHGRVGGILDVNSHFPDAFAITDRQLCENAAYLVGQFISEHGY